MNLVRIGYFGRSHGTKGHLVLKLERPLKTDDIKVLFVEQNGSQVPYFLTENKMAGKELVLLLETVDAPEKAKSLLNKGVWAEASLLIQQEEEDYRGYEVHDKQQGLLGKVLDVGSNGAQTLLHVEVKGKDVILPLIDDFVLKLDHEKRQIWYDAPEGLVDLYLSEA